MENPNTPELDENGFIKTETQTQPQTEAAPEAAPKKRRGRPPKNPQMIAEGVADDAAGVSSKPTKTRSKKADYTAADIAVMGKQLVGIHIMLAQVTGIPEMQIANDEGVMLATSFVNIANQYDLAIDGKTGAAIQLFATAAMIYGPRALHVRARMKQQAQNGDFTNAANN